MALMRKRLRIVVLQNIIRMLFDKYTHHKNDY